MVFLHQVLDENWTHIFFFIQIIFKYEDSLYKSRITKRIKKFWEFKLYKASFIQILKKNPEKCLSSETRRRRKREPPLFVENCFDSSIKKSPALENIFNSGKFLSFIFNLRLHQFPSELCWCLQWLNNQFSRMNAKEIVGVFSHKCLFARSTIFVWNQTLIDSEKSSFVGSMPSREISEFTFRKF